MSFFKRRGKDSAAECHKGPSGQTPPSWYRSLPGEIFRTWPKIGGEPEAPVFLRHCSSVDMEDEMLISMLSAYGIPAVKLYPGYGSFGAVVLGMSAEGSNIYVPASMLEDALSLMNGGDGND